MMLRASRPLAAFVLALAGTALPALAQFPRSEVSGLGATPFLMSRTGGATFETIPGVTYNIYRRQPGGLFECLVPDLPTASWGGDPQSPVAAVWWYAVNAFDGSEENLHGSTIPIGTRCKTPAPVPAIKTSTSSSVAPGANVQFTLILDNSSSTSTLVDCNFTDDVAANGCLTLVSCDSSTPPIANLSCVGNTASGSGFDVGPGAVQTVVITAQAGTTTGSCDNTFNVTCNTRSGSATFTLDIQSSLPCTPVAGQPPLRLVPVITTGLASPVFLTAAPGDRARLFVVEQRGRIRILRSGMLDATPFLDITGIVQSPSGGGGGNEQGLLSMAFHPDYATNGKFYVYYSARTPSRQITIAEYQVTANPDVADPASARILYGCPHTEAGNHNGGQVQFSPGDGFLYIGTGDGGNSCDNPTEDAEVLTSCLGKILRIDVDGTTTNPPLPYRIPASNPFLTTPGALPEIWAYGLRNPYRFSFDRTTGDLYIADVGQNQWEEVDVQPAASRGGENYGWDLYEGNMHCPASCPGEGTCNPAGITWPVTEYPHSAGCSITGGYVYRGCLLPGYHGTYFYSDFCDNTTLSFVYSGGAATNPQDWSASFTQVSGPTSYGEDADGEMYIVNRGSATGTTGAVYRISN